MIVFNKNNQQVEESWIPTTTDDVEEENAEENPLIAQETQQEEFTASEDEEEQIAASEGEGNHEATADPTSPADTAPSNIANSRRYPCRKTGAPKFLTDNYDLNSSSSCDEFDNCLIIDYVCRVENIPVTYEEAIRSSDAPEWINAMQDEMDSLVHMDTFELVPKPNKKVIKGRWVFATKNNEKGQEIFKARYVAKGFSQTPSIDYTETFLPTAKLTSIRILLQVAANENLSLHQLDVKTAYLNAPIDHEIYLEQPKGFEKYDANNCKLVMKLKKSIYGLKQSGRMWNNLLHSYLEQQGFKQSKSDHCVYVRANGLNKAILIVWVDDIILAASTLAEATLVKTMLGKRFQMKDFGQVSNFLGIDFDVLDGIAKITQTAYAQKILDRFNMSDCHPKSIPCDPSAVKVEFNTQSKVLDDPRLYREMVGSLIYLMICTRPDICYAVSILSQFMANPSVEHLSMAKHVLRYVKGTIDHGLVYHKIQNIDILGYTDASWASTVDRKSMSGYCYQLAVDSSVVSWKCKKQPIVALSSCESEYIAMAYAMQEGSFLQQLMRDMLVFDNLHSVTLYVDNMGSIELGRNPVFHQRSKHIDTRFHYARDRVLSGLFVLKYVPSKENVADIFTKPCTKVSLDKFKITQSVKM